MTQKTKDQEVEDLVHEVFSKCFLVMLAHLQRRIAADPDYDEPCFLRAFLIAFENAQDPNLKDEESVVGVATSENPTEAYAVLLKKHGEKTEIVELRDLVRDKAVGQREIMRLMQLSILLDNIHTKTVDWPKAIRILNSSIPGVRFVKFPNNQWKKFRSLLIQHIWQGKFPRLTPDGPEVEALREAKSFADVPQSLRSAIGVIYAQEKYPSGGTMSITNPARQVDKSRVFEIAKDVIYGYGSEYLKPMDQPNG